MTKNEGGQKTGDPWVDTIEVQCQQCLGGYEETIHEYRTRDEHFCSMTCYLKYRRGESPNGK